MLIAPNMITADQAKSRAGRPRVLNDPEHARQRRIIALLRQGGIKVVDLAKRYDVDTSTIRRWRRLDAAN